MCQDSRIVEQKSPGFDQTSPRAKSVTPLACLFIRLVRSRYGVADGEAEGAPVF